MIKKRHARALFILALVLLVSLLFFRALFLYSLILVVSFFIQAMTYKGDLKFNLGHVFFLSILIQKMMGTAEAIILLVFAGFLPKIYSGEMDLKSLISLPAEIVLVIASSFLSLNIYLIAFLFSIINYGMLFLMAKFSGESMPEILAEVALPFFMNFIYFLVFSGPIGRIIGYFTIV